VADNQPITGDSPPVGANNLPSTNGISPAPLDLIALLQSAHHPGAGAVVLFSGEVRDNNRGRDVAHLEYESHAPLASKMIGDILEEAKEKWNLHIALAQHRIGKVAIGETAVVVITASAHRGEAYAANRYIIDRIKHEAPIWKCEYFADGTHEWGNNCNCHAVTGDPAKHIYDSAPGDHSSHPAPNHTHSHNPAITAADPGSGDQSSRPSQSS
jgi:molybdopterin synthase catalytic subunit